MLSTLAQFIFATRADSENTHLQITSTISTFLTVQFPPILVVNVRSIFSPTMHFSEYPEPDRVHGASLSSFRVKCNQRSALTPVALPSAGPPLYGHVPTPATIFPAAPVLQIHLGAHEGVHVMKAWACAHHPALCMTNFSHATAFGRSHDLLSILSSVRP